MAVRLKPIDQQTIVITGASSGIGLATAHLAAQRGARLVLASRNEEALTRIVAGIQAAGGQAVAVVADVADPAAVARIAEAASGFGGFDTWINNAGMSIYGRVLDIPLEEQRRLFDINFWGVVHGSRVAAEHLRGKGGAIINIGSIVSERVMPFQGTYSATKHAVKAFTDALRMELEEQGAPISVTLIKPTGIATAFAEHARNHLPNQPTLPPPVYDPQVAARAILRCAVSPRRDVLVGGGAKLFSLMERFMPRATDRIMEPTMLAQQQKDEPARGGDHLDGPRSPEGAERGDYDGVVLRHSAYTAAALHPLATAAVAVGVVGALASVLGNRRRAAPRAGAAPRGEWSAIEDQDRVPRAEVDRVEAEARADRLGANDPTVVGSPYEFVP